MVVFKINLTIDELIEGLNDSTDLCYPEMMKVIKGLLEYDPDYEFNLELFRYLAEYFMKIIDIEDIKGDYEDHSEEFLKLLDEIKEYKKVLEQAYKSREEDINVY